MHFYEPIHLHIIINLKISTVWTDHVLSPMSQIASQPGRMTHIKSWCAHNKLVLNDDKTELIHFASRFNSSSTSDVQAKLAIGKIEVSSSPRACNLRVIMDASLCMSEHVNNVCKSAMIAFRKIGQIRQYLDENTAARLVHAFVTSILDSADSLLHGLPHSEIAKKSACPKHRCTSSSMQISHLCFANCIGFLWSIEQCLRYYCSLSRLWIPWHLASFVILLSIIFLLDNFDLRVITFWKPAARAQSFTGKERLSIPHHRAMESLTSWYSPSNNSADVQVTPKNSSVPPMF